MPEPLTRQAIDAYLAAMVERQASDLYLRSFSPPAYRINGEIVRTELPAPSDVDFRAYLDAILTPIAAERFSKTADLDFAYVIRDVGRFRINLFLHQGALGMAARLIPAGAVRFETLNLPDSIIEMVRAQSGLIMVVGPTGCGKSTTLAAMIHEINQTRRAHIVTIEDPIEFVHDELLCLVHQRQVGYDTESFASALRHVVRQSPDVIMIGEMRDRDTMETALSAALTGHLVLTTLHTANAVQSIDRILTYFPPDARVQAQNDLATTLVGLVSMRLLPRRDKPGRVPAVEILLSTPSVRKAVAENRLVDVYDLMKRGVDYGMCTMNQSLVQLCREGKIRREVAERIAPNPEEFRLNMQGMYTGIESIDMRTEKQKWEKDKE